MMKVAAIALGATLSLAALAYSKPAAAGVYVGVGVGLPRVVVAAPPVVVAAPAYVAPRVVAVAPAPVYPYYAPGYVGVGWGHAYWRGPVYGHWAVRGYHR